MSSDLNLRRRGAEWVAVAALSAAAWLLPAGAALALPAWLPLAQAHHSAWGSDAGAPANIVAIAQTPDGFLWLGSGGGLHRFDGLRFERVDAVGAHPRLSGSITALQATPDGRLLIGHRFGGVSILGPQGLQHHHGAPGLPVGNCWAFVVDADGDVWGAFTGGIARLRNGQWEPFALDGEPVPFRTLVRDAEGTLWATARSGAFALPRGGSAFQRVRAPLPRFPALSVAPDGTVWAADFQGGRLLALQRSGSGFVAVPGQVPVAFPPGGEHHWFDADGGLWVRSPDGALRLPQPGAGPVLGGVRRPPVQRFGRAQGLSGDFHSFLQDREGNVWLGTAAGLHRLRQGHVTPVPLGAAEGAVGVAPAQGGGVWAISEQGGLYRVGEQAGMPLQVRPIGLAGQRLSALHLDSAGTLWVGARSGLWSLAPGASRPVAVPRPDAGQAGAAAPVPNPVHAPVHALARDDRGALWAHIVVSGTHRLQQGRWQPVDDEPGSRIMSMGNDAQGRLWIGYVDRGAARLHDGVLQHFGPAQGLDIGAVMVVHGRGPRVWLGGQRGIALYEGGRLQRLPLPRADSPGVVTGLVEAEDGALWVHAADGLSRIAQAQWRRALADPGQPMQVEHFDGHDGLMGGASQIRPLPSLVQTQDGRLWAALPSGLFTLDPARLRRNALPPQVVVRALYADGRRFEVAAPAAPPRTVLPPLPTGRADLRFDYTATSLGLPQRVRFRTLLEGYDTDWVDAGHRREAVYTRVGPGRYRFRVIAANEDGVWNEQGASLWVEVPPAFWQTRWFAAAAALALLATLVALYRLRIRQLSRRMQERLHARLHERERIARELHDTLLQGVTGLTLQVQAAASQVPADTPLRADLEHALDRAEALIVEGRDRVSGLRHGAGPPLPLPQALAEAVRRPGEAVGPRPRCTLALHGAERPLAPRVADELAAIAREALANALRHAGARRVQVSLHYGADALRLQVTDDGRGFSVAEAQRRPGHFGLTGMQERAAAIGAQWSLQSGAASRGAAAGTRLQVVVPAAVAYRAHPHGAQAGSGAAGQPGLRRG